MKLHILDSSRAIPTQHPNEFELTGRWYIHENIMYIEVAYDFTVRPVYPYKRKKVPFLFFFEREIEYQDLVEQIAQTKKFVSEHEIVEVGACYE